MKKSFYSIKLLLKFRIPQSFVFVISFSLIVVGCTNNLSKSNNTSSSVINVEQNLVSNGDIELLNNGEPVDWNRNVRQPALNQKQKRCVVLSPGFQSDHALTMPSTDNNSHSMCNTRLKHVKPNTKYALSFWYRLPEQGRLDVLVFGKSLTITKMFQYNPMHWCRYSAIVNSADFSGDTTISFLAKAGIGQFKFWIDQIELYEGASPIGKNNARLEYQYYNRAYVSPDIVSPLPFAFEWTFDDDHRPTEIQYIVELPAEVELVSTALGRIVKWPPDGWNITWTRPDYSSVVETEKITINNRPYTRVIAHVPYVPGDQKQFTNYVVPVGIRDHWKHSLGRYSGTISMCLYVLSKVSSGSFPLYYYAKWDNGRQPRKKLYIEVTPINEVPQSQNLCLISEVQMQAVEKNPQLEKDFMYIGLNGRFVNIRELMNGEDSLKTKINNMKDAGLKYYSKWVNIPVFKVDDKEAKAMGINGKRTGQGGWCLSYRGSEWAKGMKEYKGYLAKGVNFFTFDDVSPSTCFCDKCKLLFSEFLKINTELSYVEPSIFMKEGWDSNEKYKTLWKDFPLWHYGKAAQDMKNELVQHAKLKGLDSNIFFGVSSWLPFTHSFAAETLNAFDFDIRQTYINWAESSFGGSPKLVGDYLYRSQVNLGMHALPLVPTLSPGLTYMHPACALDPYAQMKYQILEAMMAPKFSGYIMYAGKDIDTGDMKYMAEANILLQRFENIILMGEVLKPININKWSVVRIKKLGDKGLVLVSDYSTYEPEEKTVQFSSGDLSGETLIDAETGEKIKSHNGTYKVIISDERARLFHFSLEDS
ncbi:MAG: hypothetical protein ACUZ8I_11690 [Candidatus Scalindua sp.]